MGPRPYLVTSGLLTLGLALGLALCVAPAHADIGGMLNKAKGLKIERKPKSAPAADNSAITSRIDPPATPEQLAKFKTALQLEGTDRAKATKLLGTLKTQEAWDKCRVEYQQTPEGLKAAEKLMKIMEIKDTDERNKAITALTAELDKAFEAKCGPEPSKYNAAQMMRDALAKGSDAFIHDDWKYGSWKEWVMEFCGYITELKKAPDAAAKLAKIKSDGLRIPGTVSGIFYVYTASEASLLLDQCETLVPLIQATM